jgi:hypothetical protein
MLKQISHYNILTTPFVAPKKRNVNNIINDNLLLTEVTGLDEAVALEYLDYAGNSLYLNRLCNIALEQQDADEILYREGKKDSGFFYPSAEQNADGTYKRLIYTQTKNSFYNNYKNPTQIFGLENIDLNLNKTSLYISDEFREFILDKTIVGDNISKNSVRIYDSSLDDNVEITDDGFGNLIVQNTLFSKNQEVRAFSNSFIDGNASISCESPILTVPDAPSDLDGTFTLTGGTYPYTTSLTWTDNSSNENGFYIYRSTMDLTEEWSDYLLINNADANSTSYTDYINYEIYSASYKITAHNYVGTSSFSNLFTASVP